MTDIVLPTLQAVLDLHRKSIERFGGSHGVRCVDGVAVALARAGQLLAYGGAVTVPAVAAAIGFSLCKHRQPFIDGNKRAAWFTMFVVLRLNGFYLDTREADAVAVVHAMADGSISEAGLLALLEANSRPA